MLDANSQVYWFPEHIKNGRSAKTIQSAPDWNLSRDRFWATAMPVWKGTDKDGKELIKVVGSYAELKELSGQELDDYHRPWVDDITFTIDGVEYKRIEKVMDSWFEAGSMPFAQFHYPFENQKKFEHNFPGEFIVEYVPQVRAWFYYLNAVSVGLFEKVPFTTALVHGTIAGNDGRKMSKSYGNYTDPNELMDKYSADSLRFLLLSSPLLNGEDFALIDKDVSDVARKLSMVWNMFDFFTMYAEVDNYEWHPNATSDEPITDEATMDKLENLSNPLDLWIVSRVHQLTQDVHDHMEKYDIPNALEPILPFLDDASNWYVRRSRRRFWKSGDNKDKNDAYSTLHYVLLRLSMVMAPFTPFLSEELYQKLTGGESVHLLDWPEAGKIDDKIIEDMKFVREVINEGLSLRAANKIKVRQPLSQVLVTTESDTSQNISEELQQVIKEELNVKEVVLDKGKASQVTLQTDLTPELVSEGLMREIIRFVQNARKQAELQVDDRIKLALYSKDMELSKAIVDYEATITEETLAVVLDSAWQDYEFTQTVKIDGKELMIELQKS